MPPSRTLFAVITSTTHVPDETWQTVEIAHSIAFGYGYRWDTCFLTRWLRSGIGILMEVSILLSILGFVTMTMLQDLGMEGGS